MCSEDERLCRFVEHLARYDLICLQEVFGAFSQKLGRHMLEVLGGP